MFACNDNCQYSTTMAIKKKDKKFQMRMRAEDHRHLMQMADLDQVSMAEWLEMKIREEAERRRLK